MIASDVILIGASLSHLVAATNLSGLGKKVTLLTDGGRIGGHFAGFEVEGMSFDVGMVRFEKGGSQQVQDSTSPYNPSIRGDWLRFGDQALSFVREYVEIRRVPCPCDILGGVRVPDYLIANRLDAFRGLDIELGRDHFSDLHARFKNSHRSYDSLTYRDAAEFNHGEYIHKKFFKPFIDKVAGAKGDNSQARYHRSFWAPLYYPETLESASAGLSTSLEEYPFWESASGFTGDFVSAMVDRISKAKNVVIRDAKIQTLSIIQGETRVSLGSNEWYTAPIIGWSLSPQRVHSLLEESKAPPNLSTCPIAVGFALLEYRRIKQSNSCTFVLDSDFYSYRVVDQDDSFGAEREWHRVTIEVSPSKFDASLTEQDISAILINELHRLFEIPEEYSDSVRLLKFVISKGAINVSSPIEVSAINDYLAELGRNLNSAFLSGPLALYGGNSMSEQIVQGLQFFKE